MRNYHLTLDYVKGSGLYEFKGFGFILLLCLCPHNMLFNPRLAQHFSVCLSCIARPVFLRKFLIIEEICSVNGLKLFIVVLSWQLLPFSVTV